MSRAADAARPLAASVAVAVAALLLSLLIVAASGASASETADAFINGAFGDRDALFGTISVMIPLVLVGLAWIVASSARQLNLGLEGQILLGGIGAAVVGANVEGLSQGLHLPLTVAAAALGGALWAALPALLHVTRQVSVLLSTFLLNFVALLLVSWLVRGPMKNPAGISLLQSTPVDLTATWTRFDSTALTWSVVLIPIGVGLLMLVQRWTTTGFRLRLISANESAARHAGLATTRIGALALITSGAIAGVAGGTIIQDSLSGSMTDGFSANYGFIGIAVALLARGSALGCVAAALLFASLEQGGGLIEARVGVSSALIDVTQGLVVVLVAGAGWLLVRGVRARRPATPAPALTESA